VTPTAMSSGTTLNTVPAAGELAVDARMWDAGEQERVDAGMRGLAPVLDGAVLEARAAVGGASDGNFTAGMGVPTLDGLGAVGGGAHADHEHVLVAELPGRAALLAALIADILGEAS